MAVHTAAALLQTVLDALRIIQAITATTSHFSPLGFPRYLAHRGKRSCPNQEKCEGKTMHLIVLYCPIRCRLNLSCVLVVVEGIYLVFLFLWRTRKCGASIIFQRTTPTTSSSRSVVWPHSPIGLILFLRWQRPRAKLLNFTIAFGPCVTVSHHARCPFVSTED